MVSMAPSSGPPCRRWTSRPELPPGSPRLHDSAFWTLVRRIRELRRPGPTVSPTSATLEQPRNRLQVPRSPRKLTTKNGRKRQAVGKESQKSHHVAAATSSRTHRRAIDDRSGVVHLGGDGGTDSRSRTVVCFTRICRVAAMNERRAILAFLCVLPAAVRLATSQSAPAGASSTAISRSAGLHWVDGQLWGAGDGFKVHF